MQIDNKKLLEDIISIVSQGATYTDRSNGQTVKGLPFSDVIQALRGGVHAYAKPESGRTWKNVSHLNEGDLADSGLVLVRHTSNPNTGRKGDWTSVQGRSIGKWTTIITVA